MSNEEINLSEMKEIPFTHINDERGIGSLGDFFPDGYQFLTAMPWHNGVVKSYFGGGLQGLVACFLFEIVSRDPKVDSMIWVVGGEVPWVYLVTDRAKNWVAALDLYVELANEWIEASTDDEREEKVFPFSKTLNAKSKKEMTELISKLQLRINDYDI